MHCDDPNCSGDDESITSPDPTGWVGSFISLTLDSENNRVVSYGSLPTFSLQLIRCNDPNCTGDDEDLTSPDAQGTVGRHSSVILDGDGSPVISYFEAVSGRMKIIHCDSAFCGGSKDTTESTATAADDQTHTPTNSVTPSNLSGTPTDTLTPTAAQIQSATPARTPGPLATATATFTPTAGPTRTPRPIAAPVELMGDVDCNGTANSVDAAPILQFEVRLTESLPCPERALT